VEHFYHNLSGEKWFDYEAVYKEAVRLAPSVAHFIELGAWKGASTCCMAVEILNSGKKIKFDCIDNWSQGDTEQEFLKNIDPVKSLVGVINMLSWEAAALYDDQSIDFGFVDAAHDYRSKVRDLLAWLPKIKPGGIIAGHDYTPEMDGYNRTYDAVNDVIGKDKIRTVKNVWIYKKPVIL